MVSLDVYIMKKEKGCVGLIKVVFQGGILVSKWEVRCLEGFSLGIFYFHIGSS
jgi:hypothetical protein